MIPYADLDSEKNEIENPELYPKNNTAKWYDKVLLNRPAKVVVALFLISIMLPMILYTYTLSTTQELPPSDGYSFGSCLLPRDSRIPCGKGNIEEKLCHPQCCYDLANRLCYHRLPSRFSYIVDREWTEGMTLHPRIATEPFASQQSLPDLQLSIEEVSRSHLILSFSNSTLVPVKTGSRLNETDYSHTVSYPELNVQVDSFQRTIFNTMRGPLIASDDVWEISFKLTNESMYGLGQIPITKDTVTIIYSHKSSAASIPLIYAKLNGSYHGLLIDVETPTEVSIRGENMVVVRSMTRSQLRFHLFVGPDPKDVMRDVQTVVGTPEPLQYWMFGAHVCRSDPESSLEQSNENFVKFLIDAETSELPYESHCGATPMTLNNEPDHNQAIQNAHANLNERNKKFMPHLSPYIRYYICNETNNAINDTNDENCDLNNNVKDFESIMFRSSDIYIGTAQGYNVIYPDYKNVTSVELLRNLWNSNSTFNGLILTKNWPLDDSNKTLNDMYSVLPLFNPLFEKAFENTPPWNLTDPNENLYFYTHNLYGNNFYSTVKAFTQNLPIMTTSQHMNGQAIVDRQNVQFSWAKYKEELLEVALSGISGNWYTSTPICGDLDDFNATTHANLCVKWYQAATYTPLIKIQSKTVERYPHTFVGNQRTYIMNALHSRLSLLPYFYTVLKEGPLLRPMFYEFPEEHSLANLTTQFSVGESLLIVPDLLPFQSHINVWMPPGTWYELWSGLKIQAERGQAAQFAATDSDFLTLVRGGSVIFMQKNVRQTAEETRLYSNYTLIIALECEIKNDIETCNASGSIFLTNNMSLTAISDGSKLTLSSEGDDFTPLCHSELAISANHIEEINIYGLKQLNNFDHLRSIDVSIDMCRLSTNAEITVSLT